MARFRRSAPIALHSKILVSLVVVALVSAVLGVYVHPLFYYGFSLVLTGLILSALILRDWIFFIRPIMLPALRGDDVDGRSARARRKGFPDAGASQDRDIKIRLQQLEGLRESGLVSEEEYLAKREAMLGEI